MPKVSVIMPVYNTKEEIDQMVEVLKNPNILEESLDFISVN